MTECFFPMTIINPLWNKNGRDGHRASDLLCTGYRLEHCQLSCRGSSKRTKGKEIKPVNMPEAKWYNCGLPASLSYSVAQKHSVGTLCRRRPRARANSTTEKKKKLVRCQSVIDRLILTYSSRYRYQFLNRHYVFHFQMKKKNADWTHVE